MSIWGKLPPRFRQVVCAAIGVIVNAVMPDPKTGRVRAALPVRQDYAALRIMVVHGEVSLRTARALSASAGIGPFSIFQSDSLSRRICS